VINGGIQISDLDETLATAARVRELEALVQVAVEYLAADDLSLRHGYYARIACDKREAFRAALGRVDAR
jgi:hypothetical protein